MRQVFPTEWRTQNRRRRRFYARYMRTLERAGYVLVAGVFGAFIFAFNYRVDDLVTADKVPILPASKPVALDEPVRVVRYLASDFDSVKGGQPLAEVVVGNAAIKSFEAWQALAEIQHRLGGSPEIASLLKKNPRPPTRVLSASTDGTVRLDPKLEGQTLQPKAEVFRVVDYGDLTLSAGLSGQTVAQAKAGQMARITSIAIEPKGGTIFRGSDSVSGQLLGDRLKQIVGDGLAKEQVRTRDDIPLRVAEVTEVQVDAETDQHPGGTVEGQPIPLDPPSGLTIPAQVVSGTPSATVQVADFPPDVVRSVSQAVAEEAARHPVRRLDGTLATLDKPRNIRFVAKVKAVDAGDAGRSSLSGTPLTRTFDAELRIPSPPQFLIDAVREADRTGKPVTARVELTTGQRPIVQLLLRKS